MSKRRNDLDYIRSWFKNHRATLSDKGVLVWAAPNTSTYRIDYQCYRNNLIVTGDVGDAIFAWSELVTFEWIATLDLDYFMGKCQASEAGRDFYQWDGDAMREKLERNLMEMDDTGAALHAAYEEGADEALHHEQEWYAWCSANRELLGDDAGEWVGRGRVPHMRCIGMLEGLKMAVAQLKVAAA